MKIIFLIGFTFFVFNCFSQVPTSDQLGINTRMIKPGKSFLTKDAVKLLREFDTTRNISSGTTSYRHKGINTTKTSTTVYYSLMLPPSKVLTPSTLYLNILRLPGGNYTIAMDIFYVFSSTATARIEQVASYNFKWDKNSYTMENKNGTLTFSKFLNEKDYEMFNELIRSKNAYVDMAGVNALQVHINISKHDKKKMEDTLKLFKELTN